MRKHFSALMLYTGRGFGKQLIMMGIMLALELVNFFMTGVKQSHFVACLWYSSVPGGFITLGCLVTMFLLSGIRLKKKTYSRTDYLTQRLGISERAFMIWEIVGNALRYMMIWAYQAVIIMLLHVLYVRMGSGDLSSIREFVGLKASHLLMFFFPGTNWIGWCVVILCAISFGCASLALGSDKSAGFKIIGVFLIGYNLIRILSNMGYGEAFPMRTVVTLIALDLITIFFIVILRSHSGKKAVEDDNQGYVIVKQNGGTA